MSKQSLPDQVRALGEFEEKRFLEYLIAYVSERGEKPSLYDTARWENARLKPALEALADCVDALDYYADYYGKEHRAESQAGVALAKFRAVLNNGGGEG